MTDWQYNELMHAGVDYADQDNAQVYDTQMAQVRDDTAETLDLVDRLPLAAPELAIAADLGCGTGAFTIPAAARLSKIYAVDVSPAMLSIARAKAGDRQNIHFIQSGLLSFVAPEPLDLVHSKWALHHLPDFWKQAALLNIFKMLKPGGLLHICDVVFKCDPNHPENIATLLETVAQKYDSDFLNEAKIHIRDEFSTFDWIMEGMLQRAGFEIIAQDKEDQLQYAYICKKVHPNVA